MKVCLCLIFYHQEQVLDLPYFKILCVILPLIYSDPNITVRLVTSPVNEKKCSTAGTDAVQEHEGQSPQVARAGREGRGVPDAADDPARATAGANLATAPDILECGRHNKQGSWLINGESCLDVFL